MIKKILGGLLTLASVTLGLNCNGVIPGSNPNLLRWPYINSVTETSAIIAFATTDNLPIGSVLVYSDTFSRRFDSGKPSLINALFVPKMNLFNIQINGLSSDTQYCYNVLANGTEIAGGFSFKTAPSPNTTNPIRFIGLGDFGSGTPAQRRVRDSLYSKLDQTDLFLALGDNTYLFGTHFEYYRNTFEAYSEQWANVPLFLCYGNHDRYALNAKAYLENFFQPYDNSIPLNDKGRFFSFNWGPIHFVSLDTEFALDKEPSDPTSMFAWLDKDLASTDRPWKIALFHKPPYTRGNVVDEKVLQKISPILERRGVQVALAGHHHVYERYPPFLNGKIVPVSQGGLLYITSGGGGFPIFGDLIPQPQGGYIYDPNAPTHTDILVKNAAKAPADPDVYIAKHHFIYGTLTTCSLTIEAIDDELVIIDKFTVSRC